MTLKNRIGYGIVVVLLLLCGLAPFSSKFPDAVQRLVRMPGGTARFSKALGGVLVTAIAMGGLLAGLKALKGKRGGAR